MPKYQFLEVLDHGPVSRVRLLDHGPLRATEAAELACEWNSVVAQPDCQTFIVDCSNLPVLNSEMLGKLVLLRRQLKEKDGNLVLCGMRAEVREIFRWTKLDQFFDIHENAEPETTPRN